ncbi:hypothetical protein C900_05374 [Fulvivirga imtechensis AK7]|uniref:Uncharacterized protein n=1 Tax=Fulvivirga imtechensis AK7 TaxID=1237149 RepID=L8JLR2_9BACT|nr:hypothetical protein [Fulvivirga imtechensis]ELR69178.1 hypothetical protein C900_05374 [Fulvivirga imtechensis AK7]
MKRLILFFFLIGMITLSACDPAGDEIFDAGKPTVDTVTGGGDDDDDDGTAPPPGTNG